MRFPTTLDELKRYVEQEILARYPPLQIKQFRAPRVLAVDIPAAAADGDIIFVPDAAAGSRFQGYDGTGWVDLG